jgi:fibronectin-binding autotransporter adhesin
MKWIISLLLLSCTALATAADVTRTWNDSGTDWAQGANWNGASGFPGDSADNIAEFGLAAVNNHPNLGVTQTIKRLLFTGAGTVNLTGAVNLGIDDPLAIVVNAGSHTIACGIVLGADATIQVDAGRVLTISGAISGAHSLTKTGTGTLILLGANSYTGTTTISAGTLRLGADGALPAGNALTITAGTFDLDGFDQTVGTLTTSVGTTIALGSGGGSVTVASAGASAVAGVISGTGDLATTGAGILTLSSANSYVGGTAISTGTLRLGVSNAVPTASSVSLTAGGTLDLNNFNQSSATLTAATGTTVALGSGTLTVSGSAASVVAATISGSGGVVKSGAGTLTLSGPNTYSGTTTVSTGTLRAEHATALGTVAAGTTVAVGATLTLANNVTISGESVALNGTLAFDSSTGSTLTGVVTLTIGGTPVIAALQGANTIGTEVQVNANVSVFVASGASLSISDTAVLGTGLISGLGGGTLSFADNTAPAMPTVSPTGVTITDTTPDWTWDVPGYTYRYALDGGGAVLTTTQSFTPGAPLGEGSHTLTVAARDAVGNWSGDRVSTVTIDSTPPVIVSRITRDTNHDGHIDTIEIAFSKAMDTGFVSSAAAWSVAGFSPQAPTWQVAPERLLVPLTPTSSFDTDATPTVLHTKLNLASDLRDQVGNRLATESFATTAGDGAAPIIVTVAATAGSNQLTITCSEPVTDETGSALSATDFTYANNYVPGATGLGGVIDGNGLDGVVLMSTDLPVDNSDLSADTLAAIPAKVRDRTGNQAWNGSVALNTPTPYFYSYAAGGPWNNAATWQLGRLPNASDQVHIIGPVSFTAGEVGDCSTVTFSGTGSLFCQGAPPNAANFCLLRISGSNSQINALDDTVIDDINIYDMMGFGANYPIVFTVADSSTLTLNNTTQGQFARTVVKRGNGTLAWNAPQSLYDATFDDGPTTVEGGTFQLLRSVGRPDGFALQVNSGAILDMRVDFAVSSLNGQGAVRCNAVASPMFTVAGGTWGGAIGDGSGTMRVTVSGTNTWTGVNTFTGGLTQTSGTLTVSGTKAISDACNVSLAGALIVSNPETILGLTVTASTTISVPTGSTLTATGACSFGAGVLVTIDNGGSGGGTVALTGGSDSTGSGTFDVGPGCTLRVTRGGHLTGTVDLDGATLAIDGDTSVAQTINLSGAGTIDIAAGRTVTLGQAITGAQALTKSNGGMLVMTTASNQTSTTITGGTLRISNDNQLGAGVGGLTLNGGTLSVETADVTTARPLTINSPGGGTLSVGTNRLLTWNGTVSGAGAIGKQGAGRLVLAAANGFTGPLTVSAGYLRISDSAALGASGQGTTVGDGAALELIGPITLAEPLSLAGAGPGAAGVLLSTSGGQTLNGTITVTRTAQPVTISVGGGTLLAAGRITGNSGLTKLGVGDLGLTDVTNDFTGQVIISGGELSAGAGASAVAANGCLGDVANEVVLDGGTLRALVDLTGTARTVRVTALGGSIDTDGHTLTLPGLDTGPGQDLTLVGPGTLAFVIPYDAVRNLGGRLLKPGVGSAAALSLATSGSGTDPGTLIIADGTNTWDGACTVSSGRLVANGQALGTVSIGTGATLAGNGKVGALSVATGGTISPGALLAGGSSSPGVLRAESLVLATGSNLRFDLGTANDLLSVNTTVTITGTPVRTLTVTASPSAAAFNSNTGDYTLIAAGTLTYASGAIDVPTYLGGITTGALYRVTQDGNALTLQRNRAPSVATGVADGAGTGSVDTSTTPPSYTVGPPGSTASFDVDVAGSSVIPLVQASDPEGAVASSLTFTLKLDPSQGVIEWDSTGAGAWQTVSADTAPSTWTQADVASGRVRYRNTGSVGGNDAILYDVRDALGAISPLYLMRFTIQGSGPPVISGLPAITRWSEQATKPGPWAALAPTATLAASTDPLDGGLFKVTLLNGESGDELAFVGNGVTVAGDGTVSLSGTPIGSLVATTSSLAVTLNANASQARVTALLQAASFRTSNPAPSASGRSIELRANDGSVAGGTTITAIPLTVDLYNDAPSLSLTIDVNGTAYAATAMPGIPNLLRTGKVTPSDPEGELAGNVTLTLFQGALQGTLVFNPDGTFSYRPNFLSGSLAGEVLEDSFIVTVTDRDFSVSPSATRVDGTGAASRYDAASRQVTVPIRIAAGGAGLAFLNVPRMTVDNLTGGSFSYTPQLQLPSGAGTVRFELIDVPGAVTLGTGAGQLNFSPSTGVISWPAVPPPAGTLPQYWRFGILATDPTTGSAALLPIMLRVGTGGTNG